jgi:Neuraminidase (sialidase)
MKKQRIFSLIGCANIALVSFFSSCQSGKFQNIEITKGYKSSVFYQVSEPSIAINPTNTNELAAGSILDNYHFSKDGGKTWTSRKIDSKYGVWGDPVLTFDRSGKVYYFHLANYKKTSWIDRIVCQVAPTVDAEFSDGTFPKPNGSKAQDKHWVALHPKNNTLAITWTQFDKYDSKEQKDSSHIMFSRSIDQGQTWSNPLRINKYGGDCIDNDNTVEGAVPSYGPNGELFVAWSGPKGLVFQKSLDGGTTWLSEEKLIAEHPGGWTIDVPGINRCNGLPVLICDQSNGPHRGTLYLNWADQRNGANDTDIWLMKSTDQGETWSAPIRVNQDAAGKHQFFTWITIDQTNGNLHFVYLDRRKYSDNKTDVIWCTSKDGGKSFQEKCISDKPFLPKKEVFYGDYLTIAAHNGVIRPIWPRMDKGKMTLWTALIDEK